MNLYQSERYKQVRDELILDALHEHRYDIKRHDSRACFKRLFQYAAQRIAWQEEHIIQMQQDIHELAARLKELAPKAVRLPMSGLD